MKEEYDKEVREMKEKDNIEAKKNNKGEEDKAKQRLR